MSFTEKHTYTNHWTWKGKNAFQHWYRDNTIYFITARCRHGFPAFRTESAKNVFWERFDHYANANTFTPIITSLLDNHYHTMGHLKIGANLGAMMQGLHGSVAKLANDVLERGGSERRVPFWHDKKHHDYFDGCLRDEKQFRLTFRYVRGQSVRHRVAKDWSTYAHNRVDVEHDRALARAVALNAFLRGVRYKRYGDPQGR